MGCPYQVPDICRGIVDPPLTVDVVGDCGGVEARVGHGGRQDAAASAVKVREVRIFHLLFMSIQKTEVTMTPLRLVKCHSKQ